MEGNNCFTFLWNEKLQCFSSTTLFGEVVLYLGMFLEAPLGEAPRGTAFPGCTRLFFLLKCIVHIFLTMASLVE